MLRPKPVYSPLPSVENSPQIEANDNDESSKLPEALYKSMPGKEPSLALELKVSTAEICKPVAILEGTLETDADLESFVEVFSRRLRSEIIAELIKLPFYDPSLSVKFLLSSTPDISILTTAREAITELCLWDTPIAAKDLERFVEKSIAKLRPVLKIYRAATDPKLRSH